MTFKESYLIPKHLYETLQHNALNKEPDDVVVKKKDYAYRFKLSATPQAAQNNPFEPILSSIVDDAKRNLAFKILQFIQTRGGGSVKWGGDNIMILNGTRTVALNASDVVRKLVGEIEDPQYLAYPVYQQLQRLNAPEYLLRFYPAIQHDTNWLPFRTSSTDYFDFKSIPGFEEYAVSRGSDSPASDVSDPADLDRTSEGEKEPHAVGQTPDRHTPDKEDLVGQSQTVEEPHPVKEKPRGRPRGRPKTRGRRMVTRSTNRRDTRSKTTWANYP